LDVGQAQHVDAKIVFDLPVDALVKGGKIKVRGQRGGLLVDLKDDALGVVIFDFKGEEIYAVHVGAERAQEFYRYREFAATRTGESGGGERERERERERPRTREEKRENNSSGTIVRR
jgi:hypothetical protein